MYKLLRWRIVHFEPPVFQLLWFIFYEKKGQIHVYKKF